MSAELLAKGQHTLQTEWASSSFMMAEAFGALVWRSKLLSSTDRTLESVGTVLGGSHVKICSVNGKDHSVLRRGEEGRLHVGGEGVIHEYLGGASKERFYQDTAGHRWFVTNYLAMMDTDGLIRLTVELKVCFADINPVCRKSLSSTLLLRPHIGGIKASKMHSSS